jgi:hypothetical protein
MNESHEMSNVGIQVIGNDQISKTALIRIMERELECHQSDPPDKDGSIYSVYTTSNISHKYEQKLQISELRGLLGGMIPKGFSLSMDSPEALTKGLHYAYLQNISDGRSLKLAVRYYFKDWAFQTNLIYFAEKLRALTEHKLANCQSSYVEKNEYGITLWCHINIESNQDCYEIFKSSDATIFSLHKDALKEIDPLNANNSVARQPVGESGLKWWLRYVIIPVFGGVGALVVGWILTHM